MLNHVRRDFTINHGNRADYHRAARHSMISKSICALSTAQRTYDKSLAESRVYIAIARIYRLKTIGHCLQARLGTTVACAPIERDDPFACRQSISAL
jgi:hypothetical protein